MVLRPQIHFLKHEQGHYRMAEALARQATTDFKNDDVPGWGWEIKLAQEDAKTNAKIRLQQAHEVLKSEYFRSAQQYDKITNHGTLKTQEPFNDLLDRNPFPNKDNPIYPEQYQNKFPTHEYE